MINIYKKQDYDFYGKMGKYFADKSIAKELDAQLYNTENATWAIYEKGGEIFGFVSIQHLQKYDLLDNFFILPEYRNKKIGTMLLKEILQYQKQELRAITRNDIAFTMYMLNGFDVTKKNGRFFTLVKKDV